jgi:histidinol-phosphate/aromatic aminotransferase/cobyric acid decarboxylase-like protein
MLDRCLRVNAGTPDETDAFTAAITQIVRECESARKFVAVD